MDRSHARAASLLRRACLLWVIATAAAAHAADASSLTLSEAVAEALAKNPELRALSADVAAARGETTTATQWQNPELSVAPGINRTPGADGGHDTRFHGVFSLTQTFEFPGKRTLRRAAADKAVELRELALAGFRIQLTIEVRRAFNELLVAEQVVPLREQGLAQARTFLDAATRRAQGGVASEFEVTKAEAERIAAERALHDAQTQVAAGRAALNTLLGRPADEPLNAAGDLNPDIAVPDADSLLQQVLVGNPSLKVQTAEVERTGLSLKSVQRSRLPDFTIGPDFEYKSDEQNIDLGIALPLPLWDRKSGEIATATAEQQKALAELDVLRNEIAGDVARAYHTLESAKASLSLYTPEFLNRLATLRDATAQSYADGRASILVYLEGQRTYFDTQADYLDTLGKLYGAVAELESASGLLLSEMPAARSEGEKH
jgi:cobalt-zinc-cadmium efflux system outer membrane protein